VFDDGTVRREPEIIADDLHATAVRVTGDRVDRLELAARHASAAGMQVWFSPFVCDLDPDELVEHLAGCARRAELLRRAGADVVLVLGGEISLFCSGFVPGEGLQGRLATMTDPATWGTADGRAALAAGARQVFRGPITYAAGTWEEVDWEAFDVVSVDAYRDAQNAAGFADLVRSYRRFGKPVAVTEFGCCTYRGAADPGDAAFWFTFAGYQLPHRPADPRHDLDQASYGLVAVLEEGHGTRYPDMPWEPKRLFDTLAASYATRRTWTPAT
jgi:hypothetical protein